MILSQNIHDIKRIEINNIKCDDAGHGVYFYQSLNIYDIKDNKIEFSLFSPNYESLINIKEG